LTGSEEQPIVISQRSVYYPHGSNESATGSRGNLCKEATMFSTQTLALAVRNVRRSATEGNTQGFTLAFFDKASFGFSFLVCTADFSATLYLVKDRQGGPPEYSCVFQGGAGTDDSFVEEFLRTAAKNMRTDYERLITHFAARRSEWRFESWEYGEPSRSEDNYLVWRTHLWPPIFHIVTTPPRCLDALPPEARAVVLRQLRGHASEGMIVLDK